VDPNLAAARSRLDDARNHVLQRLGDLLRDGALPRVLARLEEDPDGRAIAERIAALAVATTDLHATAREGIEVASRWFDSTRGPA
jgi:hypothetical protein